MSDEDRLASELASLRIDREPKRRAATSSNRLLTSAVVVLLVLLLGAAGLVFFRRAEGSLFPEEVELGAVTLISPAHADVTLVATGYVYARKRATVAPKIIGRIARLLVDEGDSVKQNQVVAELDAGEPQAQLEQVRADIVAAEAKVVRARADLSDAEVKLEREQRLLPANATTRAAHEDARARAESARAQLKAAQSDVLAARARHSAAAVALENTRVRAPFTGTVVHKMAEVGEVIALTGSSGNYGIFNIADLNELEVQADVSEAQLSKVKVGTPAEIILDAFPDRRFRARVREIRPMVDRAKASVTVKVGFEDESAGVLPDMAAKVSFLSRPLDAAQLKAAPKLVAPADAVVERGGRTVVYVVEDGRARELTVATGPRLGDSVELTSGPVTGTRVVRHPSPRLGPGQSVKEKKS